MRVLKLHQIWVCLFCVSFFVAFLLPCSILYFAGLYKQDIPYFTGLFTNTETIKWYDVLAKKCVCGSRFSCFVVVWCGSHFYPPTSALFPWWRHQIETLSALRALCEGNLPVDSLSQRPVTRSFHVSFDLRLNKQLSKQSGRRWFETPSRSLWRHRYVMSIVAFTRIPNAIEVP